MRMRMRMRWRLGFMGLVALLIVLGGIVSLPSVAPVRADQRLGVATAVAPAAPKVVFGPPTIVKKVTLDELSLDGPSLWQPNSRSGPQIGRGLVLAWTGTDHRLNTRESFGNLSFTNKHIYNETSSFRPAVTTVPDGGVALAWTGANPGQSLNVLCTAACGATGAPLKLILWNETSFTAPALAFSGGNLWLSWTGTDANHSLNVLPINFQTFKAGTKTILRQFSSIVRPSLMPDPNSGSTYPHGLLLSWAATSPLHRIRFATSPDGVHWTEPSTSPLAEWTAVGPCMLPLDIDNFPHYFRGWRGTDPNHLVNVRYTESFPNWPLDNAKTTFDQPALGGPALADSLVGRQIVLAWTGTDQFHHLHVAFIGV
jgi:hypothetical protein